MRDKTIKVRSLPKDPGPAGWNMLLQPANGHPTLEQNIDADWVIIGGGFAGMAAARRLLQLTNNERIVVLEAKQVASGPGGRNSGFMIDLPHELTSETYAGSLDNDLRQIRLNRRAIEFAGEMANEFGMPKSTFDPCGKWTAACTEKGMSHINKYAKHLDAINESYQIENAYDLEEITGSQFYTGGIYTPGTVMIQPAAFLRSVADGLRNKVSIYENSPVTELSLGDVHLVKTPKGNVRTKRIILAVNGHVSSFGYFPGQLLQVFTYASMTRALNSKELKSLKGMNDWGLLPADPMGTTIRKISDVNGCGHRLIIRNHATLNQSREANSYNMYHAAKLQDKSFLRRFPFLKEVQMEHRWGGRLCLSWNSAPAFGEVDKRVWSACCQNGLGTVKGTLSGMMAAELAVLGTSPMLEQYLIHEEPKKLPPEPFLTIGANATMRWKEWMAGKEL
ncbi:NAD(P)/FAD-dependent oxidoreductase [Marinomonas flavescens]|uniref:NAD(P)/FAD-dependent oxidoreductase n=1 Tax=Marinomonas flavescens TaxID=2529379 RepID=UPI001056335B|nr:FAD-binding oxidoreductase [Marinomonas flavescens]